MDKKNTTIGVLLLMAAFASLYFGQKLAPSRSAEPVPTVNQPSAAASAPAPASTAAPASAHPTLSATTVFATTAKDAASAVVTTLENDFVAVHLTNFGGAIRDVALKKYEAERGEPQPFVFNALHADPMLAFVDLPGLDRGTAFEVVSSSRTQVTYRAVYDGRLEVTRQYSIVEHGDKQHDPYVIRHEMTLRNLAEQSIPLPRFSLSLGTAAPTNALDNGQRLTAGYSTGKDQNFFARAKLEAGNGFFGIGASDAKPFISSPGPIAWGTVTNQFFASILTPDQPGSGFITRRVKLLDLLPDDNRNAYGLTSALKFDLPALPAGG
jgi:YidC/Oxa1 family membrane protein insertase